MRGRDRSKSKGETIVNLKFLVGSEEVTLYGRKGLCCGPVEKYGNDRKIVSF